MTNTGKTAPATNLSVTKYDDTHSLISFYQDIQPITLPDDEGEGYQWDEYSLIKKSYPNLELDISNGYDMWLQAAKDEELRKTQPDPWQMRADLDFMMMMSEI